MEWASSTVILNAFERQEEKMKVLKTSNSEKKSGFLVTQTVSSQTKTLVRGF